ncbi:hypothetical protein [[Phormidium] sp. ETS-05]|uniref:hypothetical protein n=1 Tax=[Phormidium] sp. ETS-05 TaxID=222819 RepID=UPI0018EF2FD3
MNEFLKSLYGEKLIFLGGRKMQIIYPVPSRMQLPGTTRCQKLSPDTGNGI